MITINVDDLLDATNGVLINSGDNLQIKSISIDFRGIKKGGFVYTNCWRIVGWSFIYQRFIKLWSNSYIN